MSAEGVTQEGSGSGQAPGGFFCLSLRQKDRAENADVLLFGGADMISALYFCAGMGFLD